MNPTPKKRKINPMLMKVLLISGGIHLAALFIFGSITIVKYIIPNDAQFEEPPAIEEEAPPPEQKIEIKPQSAPQNLSLQTMQMRTVGNIAVAAVDVNLPSMEQSFTVSGGIGNIGSGSIMSGTRGSLGIGISDVSVFGMKAKAERILFIIDADKGMLTDNKGGLNSYKIIKDEITDMVGNLSVGTLFNVALIEGRRLLQFKPQTVPAGNEVHKELKAWISDINASASNLGLGKRPGVAAANLTNTLNSPIFTELKNTGDRGNIAAYETQYALEQNVDAVFFITGNHSGFDRLRRAPTEQERKRAENNREGLNEEQKKRQAAHAAEIPEMRKRIQEKMAQINAQRKRANQPPRILAGRTFYQHANELGLNWKNPRVTANRAPTYYYGKKEVENYFRAIKKALYEDKGKKAPTINIALFIAGDTKISEAHEDSLKDYVRFFNGEYRVIRGLDQIKSASTAKSTRN